MGGVGVVRGCGVVVEGVVYWDGGNIFSSFFGYLGGGGGYSALGHLF